MTPAAGTTRIATTAPQVSSAFDVQKIRAEFPVLAEKVNGKPLVYLDNAATSQKPHAVIAAIDDYYRRYNSNVHRGLHRLSELATNAYEQARVKAQRFINAADAREVIFVRGTTEAINLVAQSCGRSTLKPGDEVLITTMEHHSNIVPWQMVCQQSGATLKAAPINNRGEVRMDEFATLLTSRTKIVSVGHISNSLGTINPVRDLIKMAHEQGAVVMVDGAQAAPHLKIDVRDLDCDFYGFSGHKMYGPTGIGVLYGKAKLLNAMPPWQGGGEMIRNVTIRETTFADAPQRFEAGTPNIAGAIGLGAAIDWMNALDHDAVAKHERDLRDYATARLSGIKGLRLIGTAQDKIAILTFVIDGQHPYEVSQILDHQGVAIRTGHHCAQPVMDHFGVAATCRASFAVYNTREEIDALVAALQKAATMLA